MAGIEWAENRRYNDYFRISCYVKKHLGKFISTLLIMPRRKKKTKEDEHTLLAIEVDDYEVRTDAGINLHLLGSMQDLLDDEDPVYSFNTELEISGICTYPEERAGDRYDVSLHSSTATPYKLQLKIKDLHKRDKYNSPIYRKYRGVSRAVYEEPYALSYLEKVRGEPRFRVWMQVAPQMVTDSLILLTSKNQSYVSIHERKKNRKRHVQNLSVQSTNPADE